MNRIERLAGVVALFLAAHTAEAQQIISTPILTSAQNFRDLAGISIIDGGTGLANTTSHFGVARTGVIYRSDELTLNNSDFLTLSGLHIGRVIDLRAPAEYTQTPDRLPIGAADLHVNIYGTPDAPPVGKFSDPLPVVVNSMEGMYRQFIVDGTQRAAFRIVLLTIAHDQSPDLYHCSGGKDRTGWTSALLQSIAGVSRDTIMKDYLATNAYTARFISTSFAEIMISGSGAIPPPNPDTTLALLGVRSSYLQAAFDQVNSTYGSMDAFLEEGLGLTKADIYVLRAKMVYYPVLPGQGGFSGNAATGAAFLNDLQNSPLSGHYTNYNYYLQSSVDAGTLGGVESQVGGQVFADAVAYLLRQPLQIDAAIAPYTRGVGLSEGQAGFWETGFGGGFWNNGGNGVANSSEYSAGSVTGVTYRVNKQASTDIGLGYNWGSIASAGATATLHTVLITAGGRYGFSDLEHGPFVDACVDAGWVDYQAKRALGGALGTASGDTIGAVYSGRAGVGDVIRLEPVTLTLQSGFRVAGASLSGFDESGSDLALDVQGTNKTYTSLLAGVEVSLDPRQMGTWTIAPKAMLGYERILGNPRVETVGSLYGYTVRQSSAYDGHDLVKAGLSVTASHRALNFTIQANMLAGDGSKSIGIGGQFSVGGSF